MYTYDDFINTANKAGKLQQFTEPDLEAIRKSPELGISLVGLMQDQDKASTAEQRLLATEAANQLRKNYGLAAATNTGASPVTGSYGDQYAGLLKGPVTQGSFAYDPEKDPVWSAYKKQYAREGERAGENAMAQAAAMTGGRPSSYAVTAGQQAGNYYAGQMSDIIPELANNAYQRYIYEQQLKQQEFNNALNLYQTLGYATPEVEQILGIGSGGDDSQGGKGHQGYVPGTEETGSEEDLLALLRQELNGKPEDDGTGGFTTTNRNSHGMVSVGRQVMSWSELEEAVNEGKIIEEIDPANRTITYKFAQTDGKTRGAGTRDGNLWGR